MATLSVPQLALGGSPTSWAQQRLPSTQNVGVSSMIQAAGQGLAHRAIKKEEQNEAELEALRKMALDAHKADDRPQMMRTISDMARINPDAAKNFRDTLAGLDRTDGTLAAMHIYTAAASKSPEAQNTSLQKAYEILSASSLPLAEGVKEMMQMPFGQERDDQLEKSVAASQAMGFLPTPKDGTGSDKSMLDIAKDLMTIENMKSQIKNREDTNERLEAQQRQEEKEYEEGKTELTPDQQKLYTGWLDAADQYRGQFQTYGSMSERFLQAKEDKTIRGFAGSFLTVLRKGFGMGNTGIDALKEEYDAIKNQIALGRIPRGPASDKDIKFALQGIPWREDNAEKIAQFLRGLSKLKALQAAKVQSKIDYLDQRKKEGKGFGGYDQYWKDNGARYIADEFGIDEDSLNYQPIGGGEWSIEGAQEYYKQKFRRKKEEESIRFGQPAPRRGTLTDITRPSMGLPTPEKPMPGTPETGLPEMGVGESATEMDKRIDQSAKMEIQKLANKNNWSLGDVELKKSKSTGEYYYRYKGGAFQKLNVPTL